MERSYISKCQQHNNKRWYYTTYLLSLFACCIIAFLNATISRAATYTWTGANGTAWNVSSNWNPAGIPGSAPGDIVIIASATSQPIVSVTPANPIASITFNPDNATALTLTINNVALTVTGNVILNNRASSNSLTTITGSGTLNCANITVGSGVNPTAVTTYNCILTSTISNLNITNRIIVNSTIGITDTRIGNSRFTHTSGYITAAAIETVNEAGTNTSTYTLGASSPILKLTGNVPIIKASGGTSTINLNGAGSTVEYAGAANLTFETTPAAYVHLIISGGGNVVKTLSANTSVIGVLTVKAATTLAIGSFTLGTPSGVVMETVGGGNGAAITGSGQMTIGGNITVNYTGSGTIGTPASIQPPLAIGAATRTITVNDDASIVNNDFIITNTISASSVLPGIIKAGAGTLMLSGLNSYGGNTSITAGMIRLGSAGDGTNSPLGIVSTTRTIVSSGGALDLAGFSLSTDEPLTISGDGISSSGALLNSSTTAATYSGLLTLGNHTSITGETGAIHITNTGTITGPGFGLTLNGTIGGSFASILGTGSGELTKDGAGAWIVSGASTYSGQTNINEGVLRLGAAGSGANTPLGIVGSTRTIVNIGGSLDLNGYSLATAEPITLAGIGSGSRGAMMNSSTTAAKYIGLITLGSPGASVIGGTGAINISNPGVITGSGFPLTLGGPAGGTLESILGTGSGTLIKAGPGTWTVSGLNTYTGQTSINAGILKLGSAGNTSFSPIGTADAPVVIYSGGSLDLAGFTLQISKPATLNGLGLFSGGTIMNSHSDNVSYSGLITLASTASIKASVGSINITHTGTISGSGFNLILGGPGGGNMSSIIGTGSGGIIKEDAGTWTLLAASTYGGQTNINAGTLKAGVATSALGINSAVVLANTTGAILDITGFNNTIGSLTGGGAAGGNIILGAATLTIGGDNTSLGAYNGSISGTGNIIKIGSGTLELGGNSSYSGTTSINAGIIKLGGTGNGTNAPLGVITGGTFVATGASLDLGGYSLSTAEPLTISGTGTSSIGALMNSGSTANYSGLVTLGANNTSIIGGTGLIQLTHTGTITGSGFTLILGGASGGNISSIIGIGTGGITKAGPGTWILSGINTYTGSTTVNGGTLRAGVATQAFGLNSAVTLANSVNVTLDLNGFNNTIGSLTGGGGTGGNISLGTGILTIGTNNTSPAAYSGVISGTGGAVEKTGSGSLTLTATNTFTGGFTLNSGTVNINNSQALGDAAGTFSINGGTIDNTSGAPITLVSYPQNWLSNFSFTGTHSLHLGNGNIATSGTLLVTVVAETLSIGGSLSSSFRFTKGGNGTLHLGTQTISMVNLNLNNGTLISTSGTLSIAGNFNVLATFTHNNGTVDFNGAGQQNIPAVVYHHLIISNNNNKTIATGIAVTCYTFTSKDDANLDIEGTGTITITQ